MKIKVDNGAFMPTRAFSTDAGLDLYAMEDAVIKPFSGEVFNTGIHVELPKGTAGLMVSKSGLNVNYDLTSTGLIDEGYTGAIRVKLYNHGKYPHIIKRGDKISQLVIIPVIIPKLETVEELSETERGNNGFGSSGRGVNGD